MTPTATYYVSQALMGHCVMMRDSDGNIFCVESGIKRWDTAKKRAEHWNKMEAKAVAKATKGGAK